MLQAERMTGLRELTRTIGGSVIRQHGLEQPLTRPPVDAFQADRAEVERLRREVAELRAERDILKKAAAYFAREAR